MNKEMIMNDDYGVGEDNDCKDCRHYKKSVCELKNRKLEKYCIPKNPYENEWRIDCKSFSSKEAAENEEISREEIAAMLAREDEGMTSHEAVEFLKNMIGEERGRAIGQDGFYAELVGYHVQALQMGIAAIVRLARLGEYLNNPNLNEDGLVHIDDVRGVMEGYEA